MSTIDDCMAEQAKKDVVARETARSKAEHCLRLARCALRDAVGALIDIGEPELAERAAAVIDDVIVPLGIATAGLKVTLPPIGGTTEEGTR